MGKLISALLIATLPLLSYSQARGGYNIAVTINGLSDSTVYLAYHLGDKQYISDSIKLDRTGSGTVRGREALPQGIYMIVLPGKKYFEFLVSDDQEFSINCDFRDYINTLRFTGSDENSAFLAYQKKWMTLQQKAADLAKRIQTNKQNRDSVKILSAEQLSQQSRMKLYLKEVIDANNGKLLAVLVKAMLPIEIPEFTIPVIVPNPDSLRWVLNYNYNKDHFFDNIDFTDERLLRTPILYARLNTFFTTVVIQAPDSINKEIDKIIMKCEPDHKIFQFVAVYLFNHFRESEIMGHDAVMVKLADDIYLSGKADWVTKEFREELKKQIDLVRPNLIGKKAQDMVMDSYSGVFVSLYDVHKDFTILYFWEPDCGHCKEATPRLKAWYDKVKSQGIEIFAVCTQTDKQKWTKYIEENKLTWINGWDPQRNSHFDYYYNVQATPTIYVLDKNKVIIAKKLAVDDIGPFIDNYRKYAR